MNLHPPRGVFLDLANIQMKNIREEVAIWCQIISFLLILVAVIRITGTEMSISWDAAKKIPEAIGIYSVSHLVFTTWAWRWKIFRNWLVPLPDLEGTWAGSLQTTWKKNETDPPTQPIPVLLFIKQSFSSISCEMYSKESTSSSNTAQLIRDDQSKLVRLAFNYVNRPRAVLRDRSQIHDGAAILTFIHGPQRALAGEYWTSRKTTGDIEVLFRSGTIEGTDTLDII
jgi:hypothetical protein